MAEGGEKLHQPLGGKGPGPPAHQVGDVRLRNAEDLASLGLWRTYSEHGGQLSSNGVVSSSRASVSAPRRSGLLPAMCTNEIG